MQKVREMQAQAQVYKDDKLVSLYGSKDVAFAKLTDSELKSHG
jgi:uncharacterized lipoprotein YajG